MFVEALTLSGAQNSNASGEVQVLFSVAVTISDPVEGRRDRFCDIYFSIFFEKCDKPGALPPAL